MGATRFRFWARSTAASLHAFRSGIVASTAHGWIWDPLIARVEKVFVDDREIADVVSLDTKAGIVDEIIFDENDPSEWSPRRHYGKVKILWKMD